MYSNPPPPPPQPAKNLVLARSSLNPLLEREKRRGTRAKRNRGVRAEKRRGDMFCLYL